MKKMVRRSTGLQKAHKVVCVIYWAAWIVGLVLTGICRFVPGFNTHGYFFGVVDPYCSTVMVLSILIPVEPVIFIGILIQTIRKKLHEEKLIVHILLFAAHIIMFLLFLGLFVAWTGGV